MSDRPGWPRARPCCRTPTRKRACRAARCPTGTRLAARSGRSPHGPSCHPRAWALSRRQRTAG
eukprot:1885963-Prymnesium_polylepis.1